MPFEDRQYNREYNPGSGGGGSGPKFIFPMPSKLTFGLIIACVAIFFLQAFVPRVSAYGALILFDGLWYKQPWRWITYQYLHGGGGHLFFNLIGIYFFVPALEARWGWKKTLVFYTAGGLAAGVAFWAMSLMFLGGGGILIGASGCIFAVLGALTYLAPDMQVLAMMIIPITMRTLALLYTVFFLFTVIGDRNLSDAAHLGGLAFGFFTPWLTGPATSRFMDDWRQRQKTRARQMEADEQQSIDRILQKVHDSGMNSLTRAEKKTLARATERQRQSDATREAKYRRTVN
jgi:membrane associated rhomboid family serine protease